MDRNKLKWQLPFLLLLIVGTVLILRKQAPYQSNQGMVFGTLYKITYQSETDLRDEIEKELDKVNLSLSPFNKQSVITKINENLSDTTDQMFVDVFTLSKEISAATGGAFDITVAPLVNAWGFGFKNATNVDSLTIDSIMDFVGIDKVELIGGKIVKKDPRLMLDCSSVAKGYGVDCVARLLDRKGVKNYMVDIGGEVVVKGRNPQMNDWRIGINKPVDDSLSVNQDLQAVVSLTDLGIATSGNYRNFYYKDGKKYAHTINPHTGYPIQHNILSATVVAKDCATADAYATAFMVMGLDSAKAVCAKTPGIEAYFICDGGDQKLFTYATEGMKQYMK